MNFFLCVTAGILCGLFVCIFGMWAFLKGLSSAMTVRAGGQPRLVDQREKANSGSPSLSEQINSIFGG